MVTEQERRTSAYQSFGDGAGSSNSHGKLAALKLPADLTGKRVLDLGCNEGFFSLTAKERGASEVVGIDADEAAIERARARTSEVDFRAQGWERLPEGPFDVVLLLSALHYEPNPRALLRRIRDVLAPDGLFILEGGVSQLPGATVEWTQREIARDDVVWYPTRDLLMGGYLEDFAVREVGPSVRQPADPASRVVFHCRPRRPIVLLVPGRSTIGKTALARELRASATMTLEVDRIVYAMAHAVQRNTPMLEAMGAARESGCDIGQTMRLLEAEGFAAEFAAMLAEQIAQEERFTVVEGYGLTQAVVEHLRGVLADRAVVWMADRLMDASSHQAFADKAEKELVYLQAEVMRLRAQLG